MLEIDPIADHARTLIGDLSSTSRREQIGENWPDITQRALSETAGEDLRRPVTVATRRELDVAARVPSEGLVLPGNMAEERV
jgi:hypothetical protein